jgi:DNA-binding HxlR family transcriptional regulator
MAVDIVSHEGSKAPDLAAHQTGSAAWDRDLVPDHRGETRRPEHDCPVEVALGAIAGRWTTLLLRDLMNGPRSYGQLRAGLPTVSDKVLADRLAHLRRRGLVDRQEQTGFPTRTSYSLTNAGEHLRPLLIELYRTGKQLQEHESP